jgi:excisionase family DNA binding protein
MTASEVAEELGISKSGVYKLIQRGRLPAIRRSERGMRVSRLALEAYQRHLRGGGAIPPIKYSNKNPNDLLVEFEADAGMSPTEWERRWKSEEIEDSAENMSLTVRAMSLLLYMYREGSEDGRTGFAPMPRSAAA